MLDELETAEILVNVRTCLFPLSFGLSTSKNKTYRTHNCFHSFLMIHEPGKKEEYNSDWSVMNMNLSCYPTFHCAVPLIYVAQRTAALPNVLLQQRHPLKCEEE